jgi:uncharacterized protein (TIGR03437 family)
MKHLAVVLLAAGSALAADFATGQAARAVIGQPTFTAQSPEFSDVVLGGVSGLAYANGMLIVADANRTGESPINHRVLIYRDISQVVPQPTAELPQGARCPVCTGAPDVVLGQPNFTRGCMQGVDPGEDGVCPASVDASVKPGRTGMRLPTAVATDGTRLVVADTDNNRVLIWNQIPAQNNQPADVVVGQPDFDTTAPNSGSGDARVPRANTLKGPQGVWIQDGRLLVADDLNHRVLIWNQIPQSNFAPADIVLGQPNFDTVIEPDLTQQKIETNASSLLNPVAVTSDGQRLFVADLGHNRVLIWRSIPTQNAQPADVVLGQPNFTTAIANYTGDGGVCPVVGQNAEGKNTYNPRCAASLNFPRFALSDGRRLFVADGGNDRVLVYNSIPETNGAPADAVLGQINDFFVQTSDSEDNPDVLRRSSSDSIRTPMSLAWDGANLYVSEPASRRILVFSVGDVPLPMTAVRNAASMDVFAVGAVTFSGEIQENDEITIKIREAEYKYKIKKSDTFQVVIDALVAAINGANDGTGDPWVIATPNSSLVAVVLTSRLGGQIGNTIELNATASTNALIVPTASGARLAGGQDAAKIAPGSLISIFGDNFADETVFAPADADPLPAELGGVQVYVDGIRVPLLSVSPKQINAQLPFEVLDSTSASAYVRTRRADGDVEVTTAIGVPIISANPGIFAYGGTDPRPAVIFHGSSNATGTVYIEGTAKAGDKATVKIEDRSYTYTLVEGDTLEKVRDELINLINASADEKVTASAGTQHRYIRLRAKVAGPEGNGIAYSGTSEGGNVVMGGTTGALCCANTRGAPVTEENPAVPGETLIVYATGLGMITPEAAKYELATGFTYKGPEVNRPDETVSSLAGGKTATVISAAVKPGTVGIYEVLLELNPDLPTNPKTQVTIAQSFFVSNIVTFPVVNPNPPQP